MAINYAEKYSAKIDERFKLGAFTAGAVNNSYDFIGVQSIKIYSVPTAAMGNYTLSGTSRYGTPAELENSVQEMVMSQDRAFTFTIDRRNYSDTMMINAAGSALQRQIDEVIIPELDTYRLSKMCAATGIQSAKGTLSKSNAYEALLDAGVALTEKKVPLAGRMAFVTPTFYKLIKQDDSFIKKGDMAQSIAIKGVVGEVDGVPLIQIPSSYLPTGVNFIVTNKEATIAPTKLAEYKIHDNPPGINGWLVEGRIYYDAFILKNKAAAIYVHKTESTTPSQGDQPQDTPSGDEQSQNG